MLLFCPSRARSTFSLIFAVSMLASISMHTFAAPVDNGILPNPNVNFVPRAYGTMSFPSRIDPKFHAPQHSEHISLSADQENALTEDVVEVVRQTFDRLPILQQTVSDPSHYQFSPGALLQPVGSAQVFYLPNDKSYVAYWDVEIPTYLSDEKAMCGFVHILPSPIPSNPRLDVASCEAFVYSGKGRKRKSFTHIPRILDSEEVSKFMKIIREVHRS
ncbi:hypothetical protein FB446DRAFT_46348 [Lentinula raphanica]|nr:hypothetical protein FB446DRAFT_46348 [Lentinula raphanica]